MEGVGKGSKRLTKDEIQGLAVLRKKLEERGAPTDLKSFNKSDDLVAHVKRAEAWIRKHDTHQDTLKLHKEALKAHQEDLEKHRREIRESKRMELIVSHKGGQHIVGVPQPKLRTDLPTFYNGDEKANLRHPFDFKNSSKTSRIPSMDAMSHKEQYFKKGGVVKPSNLHAWTTHVKEIQRLKNVSYKEAFELAKQSFKRKY